MNGLPLTGVSVVTMATNLPGPAAAAQLTRLGASTTKVEPPSGDLMSFASRAYYDELAAGQDIVAFDLKSSEGLKSMSALLETADVLITSSRPTALEALGLSWRDLHKLYPRLVQVAIIGYPGVDAEIPGHDLTYQAANGTIDGRALPRVLVADLGGGERAAAAAMAGLIERGRTGEGSYAEVALSDVAADFSAPYRHGITTTEGFLGGAIAQYNVYRSSDGYIALAAIEGHFWNRFCEELGIPHASSVHDLEAIFIDKSSKQWSDWARERDIPLAPCSMN